jgi:hypothetical protein
MLLTPSIPQNHLRAIISLLEETSPGAQEAALRALARQVSAEKSNDSKQAQAFSLLLADLRQQGWQVEVQRGGIWVTPPSPKAEEGESLEEAKARQRASLLAGRETQLSDPAVREFLRRMETPALFKEKKVSVLDLVDDGHALAVGLSEAAALPPSERVAALRGFVRPVLEVAGADIKCKLTGLSTLDIWRYFRHTWSLEYRPTPGRTLFLLVRNAARPMCPVMGIASLANALPQLRVREEWIGWTPSAVVERANREPASWPRQREALLRTLREARELIRQDDLLREVGAHLRGAELEAGLHALASVAASTRDSMLKERQERLDRGEEVESLRNLPLDAAGEIDWRAASERPLFLRKRAETLADVLYAERLLSAAPAEGQEFCERVGRDPGLLRALTIALREIRKVGLASRLLDVNVCGAVQPYGDLLVGKLVALAVGSAEVIDAYRERYRAQASEIASQMAGRKVVRAPEVCAFTTTSLYGVAASQYNRLRLSVRTTEGRGEIHWRDLGATEGYGTVHLGEETVKALRDVAVGLRGGRNVNNVFGEGNSPRLRQVREGLDVLGIQSDDILRHSQSRRMYGLEIYDGALEALRLNEVRRAALPSFEAIAEAWRARWLSPRVANRDVLLRVATRGPNSVRASLAPSRPAQAELFPSRPLAQPEREHVAHPRRAVMPNKEQRIELVRRLYRDVSSCADHHDAPTVEALHIETPVEQFIRGNATGGGICFVTGNPGDGKTHLLRRLERPLREAKAEVCLDANEREEEEVVKLVEDALRSKRGLAIAINEGTLVDLLRAAGDAAWAGEARRQLLQPFEYTSAGSGARERPAAAREATGRRPAEKRGPAVERIKVVDLNLRNNLAKGIVQAALSRLISFTAPCEGCPVEACDVQVNAARLGEAPVVERVSRLLDVVARSGFHATMRDLQGFLAFLLVGGAACERVRGRDDGLTPYWENAFMGGVGPLFDAVRRYDPKLQTMPLLDDELWRRVDVSSDWALSWEDTARAATDLEDRRLEFISRKRRALFEHKRGASLLTEAGTEDERFLRDVVDRKRSVREVVRLLNRFFDRDEARGDLLHLWSSHRYDARPSRYAASFMSVPASELELLVPQLRADLAEAFQDFRPDHVVLCAKGLRPEDGLRIDRPLIEAMLAAEQGLPATFRRGEPEARIAAFYGRLAKQSGADAQQGIAEIRFVDMNTGADLQLAVDIEGRRYQR